MANVAIVYRQERSVSDVGRGYFRRCGSRILHGFEGEMGYFRRMLKERFLVVSTTLPSRASLPMAHSKMGPLLSTSFLSCASESSPWVLRAYQMAPPIWPMSSSMVTPILVMLSQLSPDDCQWRRENGIRLNANVHLGSLFKTRFLTVLVSQGVLDANLAIKIVRSFNVDLCLFRLARNNWLEDFVDGTAQLLPLLAHGPSQGKACLDEAFYQRVASS